VTAKDSDNNESDPATITLELNLDTPSQSLLQVRGVETLTQVQASMNEHNADYVNGSTDKVIKFELWLDTQDLSTLATGANEIFDFSFNIGWNNSELEALNWGVTGDQQAVDNSFVSYNYNNSSNIGFLFNPNNNGVASIAHADTTASVDTLSPMFGPDTIGTETLVATFYTNPVENVEIVNISVTDINIGTDLEEIITLSDYAVAMELSSFDATVQANSSHYLDDVTLHYVNSSGENTGISSVVQNGEISVDQLVIFDVVTLSSSSAHVSGIQTNDATAILKHIVGLDTLAEGSVNIHAADVNNNGSVQTNDATAVLKHIVGLDTINNFDLVNHSTGERLTQLEDNPTTVPALTIVENGDVNQSGAFNEDYLVSIEIT
jgi:hypothetical protein